MKTKIKSVLVGWKHCVTTELDGKFIVDYKFPKVTYDGDELKGRNKWSDTEWLEQAVKDYIEHTGQEPKNIDDTFVNRIK